VNFLHDCHGIKCCGVSQKGTRLTEHMFSASAHRRDYRDKTPRGEEEREEEAGTGEGFQM